MEKPLSFILKPQNIKDIIGQEHLVARDGIVYKLIKSQKMFSLILYGPPGVGKTSLAGVIANELKADARFFNAAINNKAELMMILDEAKLNGHGFLIIDEIHRLNKDKQDILLATLESGMITLIGLTTANPYYKINPAIRSRCQVLELKPLTNNDVIKGLKRASQKLDNISIDNLSLKKIANLSNGDLRYAINLLEVAYLNNTTIDLALIEKINPLANLQLDHGNDNYYDVLSAFQKSIRGSDVNASLHYLARLLQSGDLESINRRLSVIAYEDIGLANPSIGPKVMAAINATERLGLPEARIILGNIVCELALSPKSNSAYLAINQAISDLETKNIGQIPKHLKNHNPKYLYPHDYPNNYVEQQYLPDNLANVNYYHPQNNKYENNLASHNPIIKKNNQT